MVLSGSVRMYLWPSCLAMTTLAVTPLAVTSYSWPFSISSMALSWVIFHPVPPTFSDLLVNVVARFLVHASDLFSHASSPDCRG